MSPRERVIDGIRSQKKEKGLGSSAEVKKPGLEQEKKNSLFSEARAKRTGISKDKLCR